MKKKYESPKIVFESFRLSTSIAAGCDFLSTGASPFVCPVVIPENYGLTIFSDPNICDYTSTGDNDQICYDVPLENHNVFSS